MELPENYRTLTISTMYNGYPHNKLQIHLDQEMDKDESGGH